MPSFNSLVPQSFTLGILALSVGSGWSGRGGSSVRGELNIVVTKDAKMSKLGAA